MRSFPPLSASNLRGYSSNNSGVPWCCTSSERMGITLTFAAICWIIGIFIFLTSSSNGSNGLIHPTVAHSHKTDILPHGIIPDKKTHTQIHETTYDPKAGLSDEQLQRQQPSVLTRGFGLSKLVNLQKEIKNELHNIFLHDQHYSNEQRDGHGGEAEQQEEGQVAAAEVTDSKPIVTDLPDVQLSPEGSAVGMVNPAIVVLTYKRRSYLLRTLDSLMVTPGLQQFTLYVSQDAGPDVPDISDLPAKYSAADLHILRHPRVALLTYDQTATAYLAQHYKWVLDRLFLSADGRRHSHVVIMEDDMTVSPDFLTLFSETAPLLDSDPTLMCVSSWNDNGMSNLVADPRRLMRTDYFPGLGWMTNRAIWAELSPKFPLDQWDHFMRLDTTHRGRDCLIPEIARNHNIGEEGTNMGDNFYQRYLAPVAVATKPVSFRRTVEEQQAAAAAEEQARVLSGEEDQPGAGPEFQNSVVSLAPGLEHLHSNAYETEMYLRVRAATLLGHASDIAVLNNIRDVLAESTPSLPTSIPPSNSDEVEWLLLYEKQYYPNIANTLNILPTPRSSHKGLSSVRIGKHLLWLADIKKCPYISDEYKFQRDPSLRTIVAKQDESCTDACQREISVVAGADDSAGVSTQPMICSVSHFQYINECSILLAAFPNGCKLGCRGGVSGLDVPNHVDNPKKPELYGYCLTTEDESTCEAKHWSASRICPCVQRHG
jgi:alpha-1,3-mannosyl-glycoprotein beta-1,2-N-acetylglucosaminyltransferase